MHSVFEWDENKAEQNLRKHNIPFNGAVTVFHDPLIATMADPDHSDDEERWIAIGYSSKIAC